MTKTILIVLGVAIAVVALMMAGLGIKMLFKKEKEFKRPCTNADPKQAAAPTVPVARNTHTNNNIRKHYVLLLLC